jgi:23S rRNA pseudouridine1911/1915/1917 synthase
MPKKSRGSEGQHPDIKITELETTEIESATVINEDDSSEYSEILYERMNLVVSGGQEPIRLDKFLTARIENISRNKVQQAIDGGMVLVNNKTASANYKVRPGDNIVCFSDKEKVGENIIPEKMVLNIFFEDDEILIINKPPGLVVHPASGNYSGTLINGVAYYLQEENKTISEETLPRFGLVHRIDKNTSGLLVIAKTSHA